MIRIVKCSGCQKASLESLAALRAMGFLPLATRIPTHARSDRSIAEAASCCACQAQPGTAIAPTRARAEQIGRGMPRAKNRSSPWVGGRS
jgi:hypothetical protein